MTDTDHVETIAEMYESYPAAFYILAVQRELDEARALAAAAYEEAARVLADEAAELRGIEAEALTWGGPDPRGPHARKANLNTAMKWQLLSDRIRALARPEETDALARIRAEERERCAKIAEARHWDDPVDAVERAHNKAVRAIAAAIRED